MGEKVTDRASSEHIYTDQAALLPLRPSFLQYNSPVTISFQQDHSACQPHKTKLRSRNPTIGITCPRPPKSNHPVSHLPYVEGHAEHECADDSDVEAEGSEVEREEDTDEVGHGTTSNGRRGNEKAYKLLGITQGPASSSRASEGNQSQYENDPAPGSDAENDDDDVVDGVQVLTRGTGNRDKANKLLGITPSSVVTGSNNSGP